MNICYKHVPNRLVYGFTDSSDIVDHRLKLILGLIWMLILHYSISMPNWEDEVETTVQKREQTPKQRLLAWIQNKVPDRQILNFTTDWNDGKAIGALVDGVAPGWLKSWRFSACLINFWLWIASGVTRGAGARGQGILTAPRKNPRLFSSTRKKIDAYPFF